MIIVGLGHPRCGTGFTAGLLQAAGLDIPHEKPGKDGIVSWMAVSERGPTPWGNGIGRIHGRDDIKLFCCVRSPLHAIPSIIPENRTLRSFAFRVQVIWEKLGVDLTSDRRLLNKPVNMAIASYVYWFQMNLMLSPQFLFRIDRPEDDEKLSEFVGTEVARNEDIGRNSRPNLRHKDFTVEDLKKVDKSLLKPLADLASRFGYEEDADTIKSVL